MTNTNLEKYEIFYPIKGKTLREQLVGKKLAGVAVMKEIIKRAKKLTLEERLKMFPESWGAFSSSGRDFYFPETEVVDPRPIYQHSIPEEVPGRIVKGIHWSKQEDGFFGSSPEHCVNVIVCETPYYIRTTFESILDLVVGCDEHHNEWIPSYGIIIEKGEAQ
ncbi:MAG: hypothetical protein KBD47_00080 [Candidatus Pacebacteria bacterium]|jgi:hypothetical protein|nr:hypothetical protein [Candidatus Paceibacterota bacterium]